MTYPRWIYYPMSTAPPGWVSDLVAVVSAARPGIESPVHTGLTSDDVLLKLRPGLQHLGYIIETSKKRIDKVRRPVLFGEEGSECVAYEVDAAHDELDVLLEVEAGRGAMSKRCLPRPHPFVSDRRRPLACSRRQRRVSLFKVPAQPELPPYEGSSRRGFARGRLQFPFEGILLFGY